MGCGMRSHPLAGQIISKSCSLQVIGENKQAHTQMGCGMRSHPLAGQIISKSCSFSPETVFTHLILASKLEVFFLIRNPLCEIPENRTPLFQTSAYGPGPMTVVLWNRLSADLAVSVDLDSFKREVSEISYSGP